MLYIAIDFSRYLVPGEEKIPLFHDELIRNPNNHGVDLHFQRGHKVVLYQPDQLEVSAMLDCDDNLRWSALVDWSTLQWYQGSEDYAAYNAAYDDEHSDKEAYNANDSFEDLDDFET